MIDDPQTPSPDTPDVPASDVEDTPPARTGRTDGVTAYYAVIRGHVLVAFGRCPECHESVKHCVCVSPHSPPWTDPFLTAWVTDYPSETSPSSETLLAYVETKDK